MPKHGSIILYVHGNQKARLDGQPRTSTSTLTQLLNYVFLVLYARPDITVTVDWTSNTKLLTYVLYARPDITVTVDWTSNTKLLTYVFYARPDITVTVDWTSNTKLLTYVLYVHGNRMEYEGRGKSGTGNEKPGPPPGLFTQLL